MEMALDSVQILSVIVAYKDIQEFITLWQLPLQILLSLKMYSYSYENIVWKGQQHSSFTDRVIHICLVIHPQSPILKIYKIGENYTVIVSFVVNHTIPQYELWQSHEMCKGDQWPWEKQKAVEDTSQSLATNNFYENLQVDNSHTKWLQE